MPQPVLYLNLERSRESMQRRQARINRVLGLDERHALHFLNARGRSLFEVTEAVSRYCRKHGIEVGVLDSVSRAGLGDLNENQTGNRVIDVLNGLFKTWVAIAHTPRGDDTHVYGSQMFDAGMDVGVQLVSQRHSDGRLGVGLQITKRNDVPKGKQEVWSMEYDDGGLTAVTRGREGEFVEVEDRADKPTDERIAIALSAGALDVQEIADRVGLSYDAVKKSLYRHDRFIRVDGPGKKVLWGLSAEQPTPRAARVPGGFACVRCGDAADYYDAAGNAVCFTCVPREAVG
jgi:hypothetical protein